jgi:tetratricopeptide (TPR) repeat protein
MPPFRSLSLLVVLSAAACASAGTLPPVPAPAELPDLEAAVMEDPDDVLSGLRLASGYRAAGRIEEAGALVDLLLEGLPEDPGLLVMSGLIREDAGDLAGARLAYDAVLAGGRAGAMEADVRGRREVVRRAELRAEVAGALAREDAAAQAAPDPAAVGVFPFLYEGDDPDWEPLALAIPEMLATDLAVTGRLRVLERLHVQALLDELALGESGRVDESTAARSGRLLGAANIVQGRFRIDGGTRIGVDAAVVAVRTPGLDRVDPLSGEDAIERLFTLEKQLAIALHEELGVQLTPAERERINERQTESVQALLEFGRGIAAENAGDYGQAREHFSAAVAIDPGFSLAAARGQAAASMVGSALPAVAGIAQAAQRLASQRQAVQLLNDAPAAVRDRILQNLGAQKRAVLSELLGQDRVGQTTLLELIFRGPGSAP